MSATASPWNPPKARLTPDSADGAPIYAGFWRRAAANLLDTVLMYIITIVATFALAAVAQSFLLAGGGLLLYVIWWLYYALMHSSSRQATLGKMAFGIKVTDLQGERISFLRATGRYFATFVSALLLMIGFLMAAFTDRKQALHDMIGGTLVVRASAEPDEIVNGSGTMPVTAGVWVMGIVLFGLPFVIGILAAIAIPAYQDYTSRSKIVEVVSAGRAAKDAVQQYHAKNGKLPATLEEAGYVVPNSPYVAGVRMAVQGRKVVVAATPRGLTGAGVDGEVLFTADADKPDTWICSPGGTMKPKFLPANCRN